eukprot:14997078-Ditylum_brightwellii.AAC.1
MGGKGRPSNECNKWTTLSFHQTVHCCFLASGRNLVWVLGSEVDTKMDCHQDVGAPGKEKK